MSDSPARRSVTITNPQGLHARPAYMLVELAGKFEATVTITKEGERVDGKSILEILSLGAPNGTELEIEASGPDAEMAVEALVELIQQDFPGGDALDNEQKT